MEVSLGRPCLDVAAWSRAEAGLWQHVKGFDAVFETWLVCNRWGLRGWDGWVPVWTLADLLRRGVLTSDQSCRWRASEASSAQCSWCSVAVLKTGPGRRWCSYLQQAGASSEYFDVWLRAPPVAGVTCMKPHAQWAGERHNVGRGTVSYRW